jgi:hypothetical protein
MSGRACPVGVVVPRSATADSDVRLFLLHVARALLEQVPKRQLDERAREGRGLGRQGHRLQHHDFCRGDILMGRLQGRFRPPWNWL